MDDPINLLVAEAVGVLKSGGLVGLPTETVYGLGADAENAGAVGRIFDLKGRPRNHPLIVHLADAAQVLDWAVEVPDLAWVLAERFWPGPMTLILKRSRRAIDAVTGGLETVGLRVPGHPLALAVLRGFGGGVAAPSANRFGAVSPTTAAHVRAEFGAALPMVLDGGACAVGVESTILDLSSGAPVLLRPGGVTKEALEEVVKGAVAFQQVGGVRSPGQMPSHYAPRAEVILVERRELEAKATELRAAGKRVCVLGGEMETGALARNLYQGLRAADEAGADVLLATLPEEKGMGLAVADRLRKAAGPRDGLGK